MSKVEENNEISREEERYPVAQSLRERLDRFFHPVSTARTRQFEAIAGSLPEGNLKEVYEEVKPLIRELYRRDDRAMVVRRVVSNAIHFGLGVSTAAFGGLYLYDQGRHRGVRTVDKVAAGLLVAAGGIVASDAMGNDPSAQMRADIAEETVDAISFFRSDSGNEAARQQIPPETAELVVLRTVDSILNHDIKLPGLPNFPVTIDIPEGILPFEDTGTGS